ncbi:hypothetical protein FW774_17955 [Pedobacter sp. BS3]|nr:hypothetical protein FW774_17955 [Pedobacter sp. BS3]
MCNLLNKGLISFIVLSGLVLQVSAQDTTIVSIHVLTGLQFSLPRFKVNPGAKVKIVFSNTDDMDHNLVITQPDAREDVVNAALQLGDKGPEMNYIPKSSKVMWAIPVTAPEQTKVLDITAPEKGGIYPYVCTYPGHGYIMYGAMYVTTNANLPDIRNDTHIPPGRRQAEPVAANKPVQNMHQDHHEMNKPLHPYTPLAPYLYRVFINGASPAAIAVSLPRDLSYCWDAGTCRLRFAWKGGFLDNSDLWKGKGDALANVVGSIFFKDTTAYPLRVKYADAIPKVDYKGYRLINRYPEFHYTLNGLDVYELIAPKMDGSGLVRTFKIPKVHQAVWFVSGSEQEVIYHSSVGEWENGKLKLTAKQAREFTIVMIIPKKK